MKWLYLSFVFRNQFVLGFAGGNNLHKHLFRYYGMQEKRIFLMPMMVDNLKFYQKQKKFPEIFTFLYVGRLVPNKNVESLIKQFNIHFSDKSAVLKIIGSGEEESYLKNLYLSERVLFLGSLFDNDLIVEFQNASCFVLPSLFEPWGLVVNEALSAGLPVISTKQVGASYDLIRDRNCGIISIDMTDFGRRMLEVYDKPDLLVQFSKNASDFMKEEWNYNFYNECLSEVIQND